MEGRSRRISLVIPAYNEAAGIRQAIAEADDALATLAADYEVLVVDDGSQDGTAAAVEEAARERPRVRLLRHSANRGYGAALRTGFEAARFDQVAFTDADCQFHLADLASLLAQADTFPMVVGYRINRQDPWRRRFLSWGYNTLVRSLLGTRVRDCDCALKVFRKDALHSILPETPGYFVNTEMLTRARQQGYDIAEVGVRHRPRLQGASKVSLTDIPRVLKVLLPFWWSRVLFPGCGFSPLSPSRLTSLPQGERGTLSVALFTLVMLVAGLLFFTRIDCPLQEPQETRYAEIPRQMLGEGRLIVPVLHGENYLQKPPLLYWLVMAGYSLLGVHDWTARLVPSMAGFLCVAVTFWWGKRLAGLRAALAGALILCLSARFVQLGRMLTMDGLLCLCLVAAWSSAHAALGTGRFRLGWWLASALACGLGMLTKGPVALVLILVPILAYRRLDPRTASPGKRAWLAYLAAALALAAPWYLAAAAGEPGFTVSFFWTHNALRYLEPLDHPEPVWFYLPGLLLGMLPWTLLLPSLAAFLAARSIHVAVKRPPALGFFLLAGLWCLVFYSLSGCKRPAYILPAMPPLALALGCYLDALLPRQRLAMLLEHWSALAFRASLLMLLLGIGGALSALATGMIQPANGMVLTIGTLLGLLCLLAWGSKRRREVPWAWCAAITFALLLAGVHQVLPGYAHKFSLRNQVEQSADLAQDTPVICYPHRWDSVSFYLKRDDVRVYTPARRGELLADLQDRPDALLFVKSDADDKTGHALNDLLRHLPPSLEFVPHGRQGPVTVGSVRVRPPDRGVD